MFSMSWFYSPLSFFDGIYLSLLAACNLWAKNWQPLGATCIRAYIHTTYVRTYVRTYIRT
jgi:hypothetical protein